MHVLLGCFAVIVLAAGTAAPALAYVGPGAGLSLVGASPLLPASSLDSVSCRVSCCSNARSSMFRAAPIPDGKVAIPLDLPDPCGSGSWR